jgi:uroporphyrinogen decarboxylase
MSASIAISPRQRVLTAFSHQQPDRVPVDFLATNEIWEGLIAHLDVDAATVPNSDYYEPVREALLRQLQIDCRVLSYDMFCAPPESMLDPGAAIEYWQVLSRSTPCRMWRQVLPDGTYKDIFGRHTRINHVETGAYEETTSYPLGSAANATDLDAHPWPQPDWWDFSPLPGILQQMDAEQEYHIRFRIGSVFEVAWQLRGMEQFLMDLVMQPEIPQTIMTRLTDLYVENTRRVLDIAGDRLDMVYFYDDVATQKSLLISKDMWSEFIRPHHTRIIEVAQQYNVPVMYHSDGAMRDLLPELIELGVDVMNPIQADAAGMEPAALKRDFGDRLGFHGGIDIIETLPRGTVEDVRQEVSDRIRVLGKDGGYVMASSHHIQSDTPLENVLAMYDISLR